MQVFTFTQLGGPTITKGLSPVMTCKIRMTAKKSFPSLLAWPQPKLSDHSFLIFDNTQLLFLFVYLFKLFAYLFIYLFTYSIIHSLTHSEIYVVAIYIILN